MTCTWNAFMSDRYLTDLFIGGEDELVAPEDDKLMPDEREAEGTVGRILWRALADKGNWRAFRCGGSGGTWSDDAKHPFSFWHSLLDEVVFALLLEFPVFCRVLGLMGAWPRELAGGLDFLFLAWMAKTLRN